MEVHGDPSQGSSSGAAFASADAAAKQLFAPVPIEQLAQQCQMAKGLPGDPLQSFQCAGVVTDAAPVSALVDGWGAYWMLRLAGVKVLDETEMGTLGLETWTEGMSHFLDRFPPVKETEREVLAQALGVTFDPDNEAKCQLTQWLANMKMIAEMKGTLAAIAGGESKLGVLGVVDERGALQAFALHSTNGEGTCCLNDLATAPWNMTKDVGSVKGAGTVALERLIIHDLEHDRSGAVSLTALDEQAGQFYARFGYDGSQIASADAKAALQKSQDAGVRKWVAEHLRLFAGD